MDQMHRDVADAMGSDDIEIINFLPYLLKDLWEMGTSSDAVIRLLKSHVISDNKIKKILDLGCGKGAVLIRIAQEFGFKIYGVDAVQGFIDEAIEGALKHKVENLCHFEVGDLKEVLKNSQGYDVVILGAVGSVLGNTEETINKLKKCLKPGGYIIIDDSYIEDDVDFVSDDYHKRSDIIRQIERSGVILVDEVVTEGDEKMEEHKMYMEMDRGRAC